MSPYVIGSLTARVATIGLLGLALSGCQRADSPTAATEGSTAELAWMRSALERNPQLEVVASDPATGVFTVRNRTTGEVLALKANEIAAAPLAQLKALTAPAAPTAAVAPTPADATPPPPEQPAAAPAAPSPATPTTPAARGTATTANTTNYTVERNAGQVRVSGPGVSIVSSGPTEAVATQTEAGQRTVEPFICEGRRMIHLDNRNIYVDGDAITVRSGCEMYITNSRIIASGTGIVVRDAVVHVSNSHIEGANGSFDADDRARLFVRSSTFQGVPKRTELAMVQDQGGNRWR
jgi:hypothetical protein